MDLHTTLPELPTAQYADILAALEKAEITVKELLLYDALEIAKQTQVPVNQARAFLEYVLDALYRDLGVDRYREDPEDAELLLPREEEEAGNQGQGHCLNSAFSGPPEPQQCISTLDTVLDSALAGGIRAGYVTEIAGESGCGKTQLLLHLLLAVQLPPPRGLGKGALYVATESELPTNRLSQLLTNHPYLASLSEDADQQRPSLENIRSITTIDLETQEHILNFQVPVAVERYGIGLIVIDSVTANYRAELSTDNPNGLITRARELKMLGHFLRNLAVKHNIAVVVANQVSDQFGDLDDPLWAEEVDETPLPDRDAIEERLPQPPAAEPSRNVQSSPAPVPESSPLPHEPSSSPNVAARSEGNFPSSAPPIPPDHGSTENDRYTLDIPDLETTLSLEHQKPFFTGWGDPYTYAVATGALKVPALGLVWTNQVACRIVIKVRKQRMLRDREEAAASGNTHYPSALLHTEESSERHESSRRTAVPQPEVLADVGTDNEQVGRDTESSRAGEPRPATGDGERSVNTNTNNMIMNSTLQPSTLTDRKVRIMEVVFSPWTSGVVAQDNESADDVWEDIDDGDEDKDKERVDDSEDETDGDEPGNRAAGTDMKPEFEPAASSGVEFEILPSGIRGTRGNQS